MDGATATLVVLTKFGLPKLMLDVIWQCSRHGRVARCSVIDARALSIRADPSRTHFNNVSAYCLYHRLVCERPDFGDFRNAHYPSLRPCFSVMAAYLRHDVTIYVNG